MNKISQLFYVVVLLLFSMPAFSQNYKTAKDTVKLNKEFVNLSNDVVQLNARLAIAKNNLPGYQTKLREANEDAAKAATISSNQAAKATNGTVRAAKMAKRKAGKSIGEAKDARSAKNKLEDQENKITRYQLDIKKKQQRLEALEVMRAAIHAKL